MALAAQWLLPPLASSSARRRITADPACLRLGILLPRRTRPLDTRAVVHLVHFSGASGICGGCRPPRLSKVGSRRRRRRDWVTGWRRPRRVPSAHQQQVASYAARNTSRGNSPTDRACRTQQVKQTRRPGRRGACAAAGPGCPSARRRAARPQRLQYCGGAHGCGEAPMFLGIGVAVRIVQ